MTAVLEILGSGVDSKDRITHVQTKAKGPVSARQMVVLTHRRVREDGTVIIVRTDLKSHPKDPDPSDRKAYRMWMNSVTFFRPLPLTGGEKCECFEMSYTNLNLSSFVESTVYNFLSKSMAPKKLYMLDKVIVETREKRSRPTSTSSSSSNHVRSDDDEAVGKGESSASDAWSENDDAEEERKSKFEPRDPLSSALRRAEPYFVVAAAVIALYASVRRGARR